MATQDQADRTLYRYQKPIMSNGNVAYISVVPDTLPPEEATDTYHIEVGVYDVEQHEADRRTHGASEDYSLFVPAVLAVPAADETAEASEWIAVAVALTDEIVALSYTGNRRPAEGGNSTSLDRLGTAGTLGAGVTVNGRPGFFLTNWHIAHGGHGAQGSAEVQRGSADGGLAPGDQIGTLFWWALTAQVDAALVKALKPSLLSFELRCFGTRILGAQAPVVGTPVRKCGSASQDTSGTIKSVNASVWVSGYPGGKRQFTDQIQMSTMLQKGDSGAILLDNSAKHAVGLCFAGCKTASYANNIQLVHAAAAAGACVIDGMRERAEPIQIGWAYPLE